MSNAAPDRQGQPLQTARPAPGGPTLHWILHVLRLLFLALLLQLCGPAMGQASATIASAPHGPQPDAARAVAPVAVHDMLSRIDDGQREVDLARQLLAAPDRYPRLHDALVAIAGPVDAKTRDTASMALRELPAMRLESLRRHWDFDAHRLARWELEVRHGIDPYADSALRLAQYRAAWDATRAAGLLGDLPAVVASRIDALLVQIRDVEAGLDTVLARRFDLLAQGRALGARIRTGSDGVVHAIDDVDATLFEMDAAPLWQGIGATGRTDAEAAAMRRGLEIEKRFALDYRAANHANQQALRLLQLLLLPLIVWMAVLGRRQRDALPKDVVRVLGRPLSAWVLLCMLGVLGLEPDAPLLVQEFALLAALVPVLRLLPAGALRALGRWPYAAIVLYGLDRSAAVAAQDHAVYRLLLLVLSVLAIAVTTWLMRSRLPAPATRRGRRLQRLVRPLGAAVLLILLVALVCNIVGNVSMAETLTSAVIDSGYMALLLYSGVIACRSLIVALSSAPMLARRRLVRERGAVLRAASTRLLMAGAFIGWIVYSLSRFRLLEPVYRMGSSVLQVGIDTGEVSVQLGDLLVFVGSIWLAFWTARTVRRFLRDELPSHSILPRGARNSIASLSYYAMLLLGFLVALSAAGFKVSQLAIVFGALGVGIGFGLQNVVNNFVSGLVLMFERPIQPGDVVDAAGTSGTVRDIGLRATTIRTFDGADTVLPNGLLLSGSLTNWTMFDQHRRFDVTVGVAYGADPAQVMDVLLTTAVQTPGVAQQPAPSALLTSYGDSSLDFTVRVWVVDVAAWLNVRSELLARILSGLAGAGISIPYNVMDINLRSVQSPAQPNGLTPGAPGGEPA